MKIGIMQPYFFPYLGYFQLLNAVDAFVLLDDVNFIMRGYINRNSILINGNPHKFSIPLQKPSQNKLICETKLALSEKDKIAFLKTIHMAYHRAPYYNEISHLIEKVFDFKSNDLTAFIKHSLELTEHYLEIFTPLLRSSEIKKDNNLKAQDRIIEINHCLNSSMYINPIGGQDLYNRHQFYQSGIDLRFIKMTSVVYKQFEKIFIPNLSMIDVLMFNSKEQCKELLKQYELI